MVGIRYPKFPFCYSELVLGIGFCPFLVEAQTAILATRGLSSILEKPRDPLTYPHNVLLVNLDGFRCPDSAARNVGCVRVGVVSGSGYLALERAARTETHLHRKCLAHNSKNLSTQIRAKDLNMPECSVQSLLGA